MSDADRRKKQLDSALASLRSAALLRGAKDAGFDLRLIDVNLNGSSIEARFQELLEAQPVGIRLRFWAVQMILRTRARFKIPR